MNTAFRIFIVEDDPTYQRMVRYFLELNPDHEVHTFATGQECLDNLNLRPHFVSLDYSLPDMTGEEVLMRIKAFDEHINVVILSGQRDIDIAVDLVARKGAYDYITKEKDFRARLESHIQNIKNKLDLEEEVDQLRQEVVAKYDFTRSVIGGSPAMQRVFRLLEKAVRTNITVSVYGETGTGKEVIAKSIHYNSPRRNAPFVAVNMGAIPKDLLESELFGYEKGAFTGAIARKKGQFELSDGGTLFLDEIAEVDLNLQAKLLRAIQEREVTRVGGEEPIPFDARIIIATHRDLAQEVKEGRFREDLYYRLLGLTIELPPLRERGHDIILLAHFFLKSFLEQNHLPPLKLAKEAKNKLLGYNFPGNVRELKAIMELAAVMASEDEINAEDIQFRSIRKEEAFLTKELTLEEYKKRIIQHFLNKYDQDVLLVADKLDIGKSTIYRMLKEEKEQI
ncbi:sigma-54-dependent transcriptional regulator [Phaeodactylibacter luteus]|uniref:Sigma-54-dependent Fis family transcriptional regulator n=1 Tax=Phaeodactylibacter luteus TaxID=1564516 RepID=A0A5C6RM62_9BACT|nr:sigma-54 dependent transcriptional regulator [Phaeodactylibacter luteus]TXB62432.1 sigma-54-dependent Fis family transcriptional regulator [Phaeodactylibacter luteus]